MHLSRLCEELCLWSTEEFNFIELPEAFCTGSSIMPQKKNPDVPELIRGKCGRIYGNLVSLLTMMKSLPLAYNRDMQEDKEPLFDTVDTLKESLGVLTEFLKGVKVNQASMLRRAKEGFLTATDLADYLARKGLPFRKAHKLVGEMVRFCIEHNKRFEDLSLDEFKGFSPLFEEDVLGMIDLEEAVRRRRSKGGTSPEAVKETLARVKEEIRHEKKVLQG